MKQKKRDFIRLADLTPDEHRRLIARARELKALRQERKPVSTLNGYSLVMIFEKASTRTRLAFEAAMGQLGGHSMFLPYSESQLARGEPLSDTARVVSGYADLAVMRTFGDARLREFAAAASIPVINGLTDEAHPVQLLADLMTIEERLGKVAGKTVAFVGDGSSNMARSFVEAAGLFDFQLRVASPVGYRPPEAEIAAAGKRVVVTGAPQEAVSGADVVVTDVWTSMGQEAEVAARRAAFKGYCVDTALVDRAAKDCIVLHCLPAHRDEEITDAVINGPRSAIFAEAENRMHTQKALLEILLGV
ncbi:MAG: ornithine carbamoyltransferase [Myxococcaceae bacterium]